MHALSKSGVICLLFCSICIAQAAVAAEAGDAPEDIEPAHLTIRVTLPDGSPAAGVPVQQVQLADMMSSRNISVGDTNQDGSLTLTFVPRVHADRKARLYGVYRFVAKPDAYVWQISKLYHWRPTDEPSTPGPFRKYCDKVKNAKKISNWHQAGIEELESGEEQLWDVTLQRGSRIEARLVDQFDKPITGETFKLILDLEVPSRTGAGGYIPIKEVTPDDHGSFEVDQVGDFVYTIETPSPVRLYRPDYPIRTPYVPHHFLRDGPVVRIKRHVGRRLALKVVDAASGEPVADATISQVRRYPGASQGGPIGHTGPDGRFVTEEAHTDHVGMTVVIKEGYKDYDFDIGEVAEDEELRIELVPE